MNDVVIVSGGQHQPYICTYPPSPTLPTSVPTLLCFLCHSHMSGWRQVEGKKSKPPGSDWRETGLMGKDNARRKIQLTLALGSMKVECVKWLILPRIELSQCSVLRIRTLDFCRHCGDLFWDFSKKRWMSSLNFFIGKSKWFSVVAINSCITVLIRHE